MAHLAVEKALKGLFWKKLDIIPPKTHDLMLLLRKIGLQPEAELKEFLVQLTEAQVATRYPEDFRRLQEEFHRMAVLEILKKSQEVIEWIKEQF
jgi:HEPN domain-containing protein